MTYVRVKGFQIFADRHGRLRCYHRKTRIAVDLAKCPLGTSEFFAECDRISSLAKIVTPRPGTLGLLINEYRRSAAFSDLANRTRSDYQCVFNYLQPAADTPLVKFSKPLVVRIRDKAAELHGRRLGNYTKQVLSLLFAWGAERGYIVSNPASNIKGIRRAKDAPEANRPWSDQEWDAVSAILPAHMQLPFHLMMYCGLDPQDAMQLSRNAIVDSRIDSARGKTNVAIWVPLPEPVRGAIEAAPKHSAITLCANSRGKPWSVSGFRASWRPLKLQLEKEGKVGLGLTLKGLRHTVATILAEMGYDDRTIADMLGQKTTEMARHYSRRADREKKMTGVIVKYDVELNRRRTKVVKP